MTMRAGIYASSTQTDRDITSPLADPLSPSEAKLTRTTSKRYDHKAGRRPFGRAEVREEALSVFFSRETISHPSLRKLVRAELIDAIYAWLNRVK